MTHPAFEECLIEVHVAVGGFESVRLAIPRVPVGMEAEAKAFLGERLRILLPNGMNMKEPKSRPGVLADELYRFTVTPVAPYVEPDQGGFEEQF